MQNIKTELKGSILILEVDLSKNLGPSKSGKTLLIATTSGNTAVPGADNGAIMGINIYKPR